MRDKGRREMKNRREGEVRGEVERWSRKRGGGNQRRRREDEEEREDGEVNEGGERTQELERKKKRGR